MHEQLPKYYQDFAKFYYKPFILPKTFKIQPKWRYFAKFYHTVIVNQKEIKDEEGIGPIKKFSLDFRQRNF